jgi:hypothetical protein
VAPPAFVAGEVAKLAPNIEVMQPWKGPAHRQASIRRVTDFLDRNTPPSGSRRAA